MLRKLYAEIFKEICEKSLMLYNLKHIHTGSARVTRRRLSSYLLSMPKWGHESQQLHIALNIVVNTVCNIAIISFCVRTAYLLQRVLTCYGYKCPEDRIDQIWHHVSTLVYDISVNRNGITDCTKKCTYYPVTTAGFRMHLWKKWLAYKTAWRRVSWTKLSWQCTERLF